MGLTGALRQRYAIHTLHTTDTISTTQSATAPAAAPCSDARRQRYGLVARCVRAEWPESKRVAAHVPAEGPDGPEKAGCTSAWGREPARHGSHLRRVG